MPWDALISRNQLYGSVSVDATGATPMVLAFARNPYEQFEKILDAVSMFLVGTFVPILIGKVSSRHYERFLQKRFPKHMTSAGKTENLLAVPFEWLDNAGLTQRLATNRTMQAELKAYGLKSLSLPLVRKIRNGKLLAIMLVDCLALFAIGNTYAWGKNHLTQRLAQKDTRPGAKPKAVPPHDPQRARRFWASLGVGLTGSLALPLGMYTLLTHPAKAGSASLVGKVKAFLPWFNYANGFYLSKYLLMFLMMLNWNTPSFLAARDRHERTEVLWRSFAADMFFFVGEDFLSGHLGKWLQKRYRNELGPYRLIKNQPGFFGNPDAKGLHEVWEEARSIKNPKHRKAFLRWGRRLFAMGMLGTAAALAGFIAILMLLNKEKPIRQGVSALRNVWPRPTVPPTHVHPVNRPWSVS